MDQTKSEGKIIKVQKERGFGFIISREHQFVKFFFHWTGLIQDTKNFKDLEEGMKVKFIPILNDANPEGESKISRGPRAIQIEIIEKE